MTALIGKMTSAHVPKKLVENAKILDKHYIPARYPNGFDSGAPTDFYTRKEAKQAISHSEEIIEFCKHQIYGP